MFKDKKVLITGAGRGIGRGTAEALVKEGALVFALSRTKSNLDDLVEKCPTITPIVVDLSDYTATLNALKPFLPFHMLVNNAGIIDLQDFLEVTPDAFDKVFHVNVKMPFFLAQTVAKSMVEKSIAGSIVNVSSQAAYMTIAQHSVYSATKSALDSFTASMSSELGPHGIRVNSVNPTVVMTELGRLFWSPPERSGPMLKRIPNGRFAEVEEVVNAIMFLLSDKASMINGVTLPVDGGAKNT